MSVLMLLHDAIASVCPIDGVSVAEWSNKPAWHIEFALAATQAQRDAAAAVVVGFDVVAAEASLANDIARRLAIRAAPERAEILERLRTVQTLQQCRDFVNGKVTDLASAKEMFARILFLLALDARS